MTSIDHDSGSQSSEWSSASPFSFTHFPGGTPKGVLLFIFGDFASALEMTAVTYGGVAMSRVNSALTFPGENGYVDVWSLNASIPVGSQSVQMTYTSAGGTRWATCFTQTCDTDTTTVKAGETLTSTSQANPSVAIKSPGLRYTGLFSGQNATSSLTQVHADMVPTATHDFGSQVALVSRHRADTHMFDMGYTSTAEDVAMAGVVVTDGPATWRGVWNRPLERVVA